MLNGAVSAFCDCAIGALFVTRHAVEARKSSFSVRAGVSDIDTNTAMMHGLWAAVGCCWLLVALRWFRYDKVGFDLTYLWRLLWLFVAIHMVRPTLQGPLYEAQPAPENAEALLLLVPTTDFSIPCAFCLVTGAAASHRSRPPIAPQLLRLWRPVRRALQARQRINEH